MDYYKISRDLRKEVIGNSTFQIGDLVTTLPYEQWGSKDPKNLRNLNNYNFILDSFAVKKGAKLTDYIGIFGPYGRCRMISQRLYDIIIQFNIADHDFFKTTLLKNDEVINGFGILRWREQFADKFADYNKTSYGVKAIGKPPDEVLDVKSFKELMSLRNTPRGTRTVTPIKLILQSNFDLDIFPLFLGTSWYASEQLKKRIEYEGLTGMLFEPTNLISRLDKD